MTAAITEIPSRLRNVSSNDPFVAGADDIDFNKPASTGTTGDYPYNGLGRIVLKKKYSENIDYANQPILEQADFDDDNNNHLTNTVFVIKYDFVLTEDIILGSGCVLEFDGGSVSGAYTLTGNNTFVFGKYNFGLNTNLSGTFYKSVEDLNKNVADLSLLGCTEDENSASKNTSIINSAIHSYKIFDFSKIYPINDSIDINISYLTFIGKDRFSCGLKMVSDNKPMFIFRLENQNAAGLMLGQTVEGLSLTYKNWQIGNTNSAVFRFLSEKESTPWGWGWQQMNFKNLHIQNAAYIAYENLEPIWDSYWYDIFCWDIAIEAFHLYSSGQLQNVFDNIRILNYNHRTDNDHNDGGIACFYIKGEVTLRNIDVEDWRGNIIFNESSPFTSLDNSHFERCFITTTNGLFYVTGGLSVTNTLIQNTTVQIENNYPAGYFRCNNLVIKKVTLDNEIYVSGNIKMFSSSSGFPRIETDIIYSDTLLFPPGYGDRVSLSPFVKWNGEPNRIAANELPIPPSDSDFPVGCSMFDTTNKKPVYWNGSAWV